MRFILLLVCVACLTGCETSGGFDDRYIKDGLLSVQPIAFSSIEGRVRNAFQGVLKDPGSLQFTKVRASRMRYSGGTISHIACGYFNSRNGFGGYTGFEPFAWVADNNNRGSIYFAAVAINGACPVLNASLEPL